MNTDTIIAMLCELIETHMEKCDDGVPHIISESLRRAANIVEIRSCPSMAGGEILLTLDTGDEFWLLVRKSS